RVLVLHGHGDVREGLVVAEADVERRPVALDEVLLQMEGLDLRAGDDHLDVGDPVLQLPDPRARVAALLEVAPDARAQRLRLPDVEHVSAVAAEEVDARLRRQRPQLALDPRLHRTKRSPRYPGRG